MTSAATRSKVAPDIAAVIDAIASVVQDAPRPVGLHEPLFAGNENRYVQSCIDTAWVSSAGSFVDRFEADLVKYCGTGYAVAAVNGTCALQAALTALGVEPGDEVLVPSLTFVATANAVSHAGAVPHFVEVEDESLGIDPEALGAYLAQIATIKGGHAVNKKTGRIIRTLVPVHVFGHPCRIDALQKVADEYRLVLIEDATEALGSTYHGKKIGSRGTAVFSFNGNKIITTGGGGAVVTPDEKLAKRLKHLTSTAKQPHPWEFNHDAIGWNYRLPNLNAALGCAQLEQMGKFIAAKRALAEQYMRAFAAIPGMRILGEPPNSKSNYWLVTLMADKADRPQLQTTLQALHDAGLLCRPVWTPLHLLPMYRDCPKSDLALTESLSARIISLPSSVKLGLRYV